MKFRPCIDIHNGKVKQIVGGSLSDEKNHADENFVSEYDGSFYGNMYKQAGLDGGHIILLDRAGTQYYELDKQQAFGALSAFEGGIQIGGGINAENAKLFLDKGASHVIVTSYVFKDGAVDFDALNRLVKAVGKKRLVLDLSCRCREGRYFIVTDRWQKFTDVELNEKTIEMFSESCDEFLIHAVDVEGKASGIERGLAKMLGDYYSIPTTYAGGISSFDDLEVLKKLGNGKIDFTIGSALDIFGGKLRFEDVVKFR